MRSKLKMTIASLRTVIAQFPQASESLELTHIEPMHARMRMAIDERHLRPGQTVSGPTMFLLADCAFYIATLAMVGPKKLSVTTNANINFMRRPKGAALVAEATILKLGRHLSVGEVRIYAEHEREQCVAHATMTYSIPADGVSEALEHGLPQDKSS
jgi:uncharacterized protein (TIGR00369 family)